MSPSRTRKPTIRARPRAEVITAVTVAVAIVAGTVLVIWLMRPGAPGVPGGGGLLSRQSRATLLGVLTAAALVIGIWWVLNGHRRPRRLPPRIAVTATAAVVLGAAIAAAVLWPDGLIRHWPKQIKQVENPLPPAPRPTSATSKATNPGTAAKTSAPGATNATPTATATTTGK
jgi:hypothetical protein